MRILISSFVAATMMMASPSYGDGLVYKLPKDGTSASYKMKLIVARGDQKMEGGGALLLRSVGRETKDGAKCRWLEFKMEMSLDGRDQTIIAKVLVPEKELAKGKSPIDHVKKAWLKQRDNVMEVDDIKGNQGGPLPVFLTGPVKDAKKLPAKVVESKLGKLKCVGVASKKTFTQGDREMEADILVRLNDKAPFGVVQFDVKMTTGEGDRKQHIEFKLIADGVGTGAKSELPDNN